MRDYMETIENAVTPLGAYVEQMGGGCTAWWINLPNNQYALITYYEGDHEGNPVNAHWMVGRYDEEANDIDFRDDCTLAEAVAVVSAWRR